MTLTLRGKIIGFKMSEDRPITGEQLAIMRVLASYDLGKGVTLNGTSEFVIPITEAPSFALGRDVVVEIRPA